LEKFFPNLGFTLEKEQNITLNLLDITINRNDAQSEWQFRISIFRKPTTTDCIIPHDSCHPINHREASVRLISNRLYTFTILPQGREIEIKIISNIFGNNNF